MWGQKKYLYLKTIDVNVLVSVWIWMKCTFFFSFFFFFFPACVSALGDKCTIHVLKNLKMDLTVLFTHLKIILLQCFKFSVLAKISCIQMDP